MPVSAMTKRARITYILLALFSGALTASLAYRDTVARRWYAEWYDTAESIVDLIAASREHGCIVEREHPEQVVRAVQLRENEMHPRANVDFEAGLSLDGWGQPIRMWLTQDGRAIKIASFGQNGRDDGGNQDDILAECRKYGECVWSPWPFGMRVLHESWLGYALPAAALIAVASAYIAARGYRLLWHGSVAALSLLGLAVAITTVVRPPQSPFGRPLLGIPVLGYVSVWGSDLVWIHSGPPAKSGTCQLQSPTGPSGEVIHLGSFRVTRLGRSEYLASAPLWMPVSFLAMYPFAIFPIAWRRHRRARRRLMGFCRNCGYNLTGLPEPRCPECGTPFRPEIFQNAGRIHPC